MEEFLGSFTPRCSSIPYEIYVTCDEYGDPEHVRYDGGLFGEGTFFFGRYNNEEEHEINQFVFEQTELPKYLMIEEDDA
jgi:hypothetical protein